MRKDRGSEVSSNSVYIDPLDCDSTVGYKIIWEKYAPECPSHLTGTIDLSDCNRKVTWSFYDDESSLDKVDVAISILQAFRRLYAIELKKVAKEKPKKSKSTKST